MFVLEESASVPFVMLRKSVIIRAGPLSHFSSPLPGKTGVLLKTDCKDPHSGCKVMQVFDPLPKAFRAAKTRPKRPLCLNGQS